MSVHCILYVSDATKDFSNSDIEVLLDTSIEFNAKNDITGILLYRKGRFMQLLEGNNETVTNLYHKIYIDDRHKNCETLFSFDVPERNIETWSMGFLHIKEDEFNTEYVDFVMQLANTKFKDNSVLLHEQLLQFAANDNYSFK